MRVHPKADDYEAYRFAGLNLIREAPDWLQAISQDRSGTTSLWVRASGGNVEAEIGDWVLKNDAGRVLICPAAIFSALFEAA
jgi:hypothetical protein